MNKLLKNLMLASITITSGCLSISQANESTNHLTLTEKNTQPGSDETVSEQLRLKSIFEKYTDAQYQFNPFSATFKGISDYNDQFLPIISSNNLERRLALVREVLNQLNSIDSDRLSVQDLLSYQMFKRERVQTIESSNFPSQQLPINQMFGMHNFYFILVSDRQRISEYCIKVFRAHKDIVIFHLFTTYF